MNWQKTFSKPEDGVVQSKEQRKKKNEEKLTELQRNVAHQESVGVPGGGEGEELKEMFKEIKAETFPNLF